MFSAFCAAKIYDEFKSRYVEKVKVLVSGDLSNEDTFIGSMISEGEAERLHGWIEEEEKGATILWRNARRRHA